MPTVIEYGTHVTIAACSYTYIPLIHTLGCFFRLCVSDPWSILENPVTRNRTRDHLISARFYSQMLYQLSYDRSDSNFETLVLLSYRQLCAKLALLTQYDAVPHTKKTIKSNLFGKEAPNKCCTGKNHCLLLNHVFSVILGLGLGLSLSLRKENTGKI